MPADRDLREAAVWTAQHGWPVFPLVPRGSFPALHSYTDCPATGVCTGGHRGWEQRATTETERIERCWSHAAYNVGLATGPAGLLVIDLDMPKPGKHVPNRWAEQGAACGMDVFLLVCADAGQPPPLDTFTVETPSGGTHLYFTAPTEVELRNTAGERGHGLGWGIDTRARGGYVVAAGSLVPPGGYELLDDHEPADLPGGLVQRLVPKPRESISAPREIGSANRPRYVRSALEREVKRVAGALPGARNKALFIAACALGQLVAGGALAETDMRAALERASQPHVEAGAYSDHQRHSTIASGLQAGASRPRTLDQGDQAA